MNLEEIKKRATVVENSGSEAEPDYFFVNWDEIGGVGASFMGRYEGQKKHPKADEGSKPYFVFSEFEPCQDMEWLSEKRKGYFEDATFTCVNMQREEKEFTKGEVYLCENKKKERSKSSSYFFYKIKVFHLGKSKPSEDGPSVAKTSEKTANFWEEE